MKRKMNKGITLIALVITIIVLLILAGISLATLIGKNGVLTKANSAKDEHKINQYKEEINLIVADEIAERQVTAKTESFHISLKNRITEKEWVENISENEEEANKVYLIIKTKEGYEITVEIDNNKDIAKIVNVSKIEGEEQTVELSFDANGGEGALESVKVIPNKETILPQNKFTKENHYFVNWNTKADGSGQSYSDGATITLSSEPITLFAQWKKELTVSFNANGGTGTMNSITVPEDKETLIPVNQYMKEGYEFCGWKTASNKWFFEGNMTLTEDTTLIAQWVESSNALFQGFKRGIAVPNSKVGGGLPHRNTTSENMSNTEKIINLMSLIGLEKLSKEESTRKFQYIYSGTNNYDFVSNSNTNTWILVFIRGNGLTSSVSIGNFKLNFSDGNSYTLPEGVENGVVDELMVANAFGWNDISNILVGGSTGTKSYPDAYIVFKVKDMPLSGVQFYSSQTFAKDYDGLHVYQMPIGWNLSRTKW